MVESKTNDPSWSTHSKELRILIDDLDASAKKINQGAGEHLIDTSSDVGSGKNAQEAFQAKRKAERAAEIAAMPIVKAWKRHSSEPHKTIVDHTASDLAWFFSELKEQPIVAIGFLARSVSEVVTEKKT